MEASKYFIRKSVIAYKKMFHGSGDRYVLLEDVLKFIAGLEAQGITVTFDDDGLNKD